jgi:hypothetical protein
MLSGSHVENKPRGRWRAWAFGAVLSTAGCADEFDVPIVWEGVNLRVGTDMDIEDWCPGTLGRMDAYTGAIKNVMQVQPDLVFDFYVLAKPLDEYREGCAGLLGCAWDHAAYSQTMPNDHELVHAVRSAEGFAPQFLEEGSASHWGGIFSADEDTAEQLAIRDVLEASVSRRMTPEEYLRAAHFTSYLVHEYGTDLDARLLRETTQEMDEDEIDGAFRHAFDRSLDEVFTDYEVGWPWCSAEAMRSSFFDCAEPAVTVCEGPIEMHPLVHLEFGSFPGITHKLEFDVACTDDDVVGPSFGWMWRDVVIDVPVAGEHQLRAISTADPGGARVTLKRCDTQCQRAEPVNVSVSDNGALVRPIDLDPGRYVLRLAHRAESAGPIAIGWTCPD